jgi:type II secretory pathway pseudopilin PulG
MKMLVDIAAVLLVAAVVWAVITMRLDQQERDQTEQAVLADVKRFGQEVQKRAATGGSDTNARGWPVTIDPAWFEGHPPQNPLLSSDRPWVEVASPDRAHLMHPEVRVAADRSMAAFWYNPYQGVVRTRVPATLNDEQALALYNRLNRTSLTSLFQTEAAPIVAPATRPAEEVPPSGSPALELDPSQTAGVGESGLR